NCKISVPGRHDPCIARRAVPAVEAAVALAILDALLEQKKCKAFIG
ncbi:MAG: chorismate synthase, partial [Firmicutes bacterium]|nr:chorismate synthase [Bacillota bacterium]